MSDDQEYDDESDMLTSEEEEVMRRLHLESRMVFNPDTKIYDCRKLRPSENSENASVKLPGPATPPIETELAMRSELYGHTIHEYKAMKEITRKQKINLNQRQRRGLELIKKFGGKFAVASREAYDEMG